MDDLNKLPWLDHVLREVLRLYAPVAAVQRTATEDDIIPLEKPVVDKNGVTRTELQCAIPLSYLLTKAYTSYSIRKGDGVVIPIRILNRSTAIWGEDAQEFR